MPTGIASWPAARWVVPCTSPLRKSRCISSSNRRISSIRPYDSRYGRTASGASVSSCMGGRRGAVVAEPVGHGNILGLELVRGLEAEVEVLQQQRRREGGREVEVDERGRLVAGERGSHHAVVEEREEVGPRHAALLGEDGDLGHAL